MFSTIYYHLLEKCKQLKKLTLNSIRAGSKLLLSPPPSLPKSGPTASLSYYTQSVAQALLEAQWLSLLSPSRLSLFFLPPLFK